MTAPANDTLAAAELITSGGSLAGTTAEATSDAFEQSVYGGGVRTTWYRWDNDTGIPQDFTLAALTADSPALDDLVIGVWQATTASFPVDADDLFTNWGGAGDIIVSGVPVIAAAVPDGDSIILLVHTDSGGEGDYGFSATFDAAPDVALEGRVSIGFDANMLDPSPVWTVIDTVRDNLVARIEIRDGRQSEQDDSEAGTATVFLNDTTGLFDPNNASGPYFGQLDGKPIAIALWNPVDEEWVPQWRGTIDDWKTVLSPHTSDGVSILANVQIEAVDMFDYLAGAEMEVGISGHPPPSGSEGIVFYEDAEVATGTDDPADGGRIELLLDNAGISSDMYIVFSGNVNVLEGKYDAGDSYMVALREAADAEFPGIANMYVDKLGRYVFHGRFARLDPDGVWTSLAGSDAARDAVWKFRRWKAGDGAAIIADPDCAQIREFAYARPRSMLINTAISYPEGIDETEIAGQVSRDPVSIDKYGIHGRSDTELQVAGHKTNGDTGEQQCAKYALFWVTYYAQPLERIETIVFKSVYKDDDRAVATWGLLTGASISDIVELSVGYPGGTGIQARDYYIEGRALTIEPLNDEYDMVTLALNLSPAIADTEGIFD